MDKKDHTVRAMNRQLNAMGVKQFEVGILDPEEGKMLPRCFSFQTLVKSAGFLKHQNYNGCHIYVRPEGSQGILLVDDLTRGTLAEMEHSGIVPACVIETSPMNYQAWVRVSTEPISEDLATATAQILAKRFNADPNSADWRHYGRLAGFTNRKPAYVDVNGRYPFVLVRESKGKITPNATELLTAGADWLEEKMLQVFHPVIAVEERPETEAVSFFESEFRGFVSRYGSALNHSRADWAICLKMARKGYNREEITQALAHGSPDIESRKVGHLLHYIKITLDNIFGVQVG